MNSRIMCKQMVLVQVVVTCRKMQIDKFLCPFTKVKSKWIKNLHIKPDRLIFIVEKLGKILKHMGTWENFLNRTPMTYARRSSINIWDDIKLQRLYKTKVTVNRTKQQPKDWKRVFTHPVSNRELIHNIYKELKKIDSKDWRGGSAVKSTQLLFRRS